tara:strand:- start:11799 stop:12638 length:840 start_codon:yes stop_codon:yes gene_type:complete
MTQQMITQNNQQSLTQNNQQSLTQFNKLISRDKTGDYGILPTEIWDIIYHIKYLREQYDFWEYDLYQNTNFNLIQHNTLKINELILDSIKHNNNGGQYLSYDTISGRHGVNKVNIGNVMSIFHNDVYWFDEQDADNAVKWIGQKNPRIANRQKINELLEYRFRDYEDLDIDVDYSIFRNYTKEAHKQDLVDILKSIYGYYGNNIYKFLCLGERRILAELERDGERYQGQVDYTKWQKLCNEKKLPRFYSTGCYMAFKYKDDERIRKYEEKVRIYNGETY